MATNNTIKIVKGSRQSLEIGQAYVKEYSIGDFWVGGGNSDIFYMNWRPLMGFVGISRRYGVKLIVKSTKRTKEFNATLEGSAPNSKHITGEAIDFSFPKKIISNNTTGKSQLVYDKFIEDIKNPNSFIRKEFAYWKLGEIILYNTFVHIAVQDKFELIDERKTKVDDQLLEQIKHQQIIDRRSEESAVKDYYEHKHLDTSITTVNQLINTPNSPIKFWLGKEKEFIEYKNAAGASNLDNIWLLLTDDQRKDYSPAYKGICDSLDADPNNADLLVKKNSFKPVYNSSITLPLPDSIILFIPKNKANIEVFAAIGKNVFIEQQNFNTFMDIEYKALMNDPGYVRSSVIDIKGGIYGVQYQRLLLSVWIYVRALNEILDISPFIKNIDSFHTESGGNFSFSLNDISDIDSSILASGTYINYIHKVFGGNFKSSYFNKYIQQNDIVFIRYEQLDIEKREKESNSLIIDKSELANKIYDMIGLVDTNQENYNANSNTPSINISGRDLTKILMEDGSYFFPFALINGGGNFFLNYNVKDTVFKRLFVGGEYISLFTAVYRSIRDSLGFIFNQLTNVGILPKDIDLFSSYRSSLNRHTGDVENRISKRYEISQANKEYLEEIEVNGIWQIIKLIVDNQIDSRRLNNGELSNPEGSIHDIARRICQDPFVEFFGETYGDQFIFTARQAPFTKAQIRDYFTNNNYITIEANQVDTINLAWTEQFYTWYQLQPASGLYGSDQFLSGTTIPIVYFEEMAERFGMHKKVVVDNYIPFEVIDGVTNKENIDDYRNALANDMKYLIETNFILPFTRRGTIILHGDRRIKKNTWIYFAPTNEVFYVKSVAHSLSSLGKGLVRTTTIVVERGMIKEYVIDDTYININGDNVLVNYFGMVNLDVIYDGLVIKIADNKMQISDNSTNKQLLNKPVFDFFYKRKQFIQ